MQRWEHLVVTVPASNDDHWGEVRGILDRYGAEGWELTSFSLRPIIHIEGGTSAGNFLMGAGAQVNAYHADSFAIFKRPIVGGSARPSVDT